MENGRHLTDEEWTKILTEEEGLDQKEAEVFIPAMRLADNGQATKVNMDKLREDPVFRVAEMKVFGRFSNQNG
jgi:DNA topoisomerase IA